MYSNRMFTIQTDCFNPDPAIQAWMDLHQGLGIHCAMRGWLHALATERQYLLQRPCLVPGPAKPVLNCPDSGSNPAKSAKTSTASRNVLILGAGPVGMMLAIGWKRKHGKRFEVTLLDNRITQEGIAAPYSRAWPVNLPVSSLSCFLPEATRGLGSTHFVPWTLCELELHLQAEATRQGCSILYSAVAPGALIEQLDPVITFDATGGRLNKPGQVVSSTPLVLTAEDLQIDQGYPEFSMRPSRIAPDIADKLSIALFENGVGQPCLEGRPLAHWMIKITGMENGLGFALRSMLLDFNHDNWGFLWPTNLTSGDWLGIFHLREHECQVLKPMITQPTPIHKVQSLFSTLDPRWAIVLDFLCRHAPPSSRICLEPPYLWEPRVFLGNIDHWRQADGRWLVPIGDSLYHGHPKVGNGLGVHSVLVGRFLA